MNRDLSELSSRPYDLVIIGAGIFGACAAWDATLRGLSVALLDRADFAHAASANCFRGEGVMSLREPSSTWIVSAPRGARDVTHVLFSGSRESSSRHRPPGIQDLMNARRAPGRARSTAV